MDNHLFYYPNEMVLSIPHGVPMLGLYIGPSLLAMQPPSKPPVFASITLQQPIRWALCKRAYPEGIEHGFKRIIRRLGLH